MKLLAIIFSVASCVALSSCGSAPDVPEPIVPDISASEGIK